MTLNRRHFVQSLVTTGVALGTANQVSAAEQSTGIRIWVQDHIVAKNIHKSIRGRESSQYVLVGTPGQRNSIGMMTIDGKTYSPTGDVGEYDLGFSQRAAKSENPIVAFEIPKSQSVNSATIQGPSGSVSLPDKAITALNSPPKLILNDASVEKVNQTTWELKYEVENNGSRPGWFRATSGPQYNPKFYLTETLIQPQESRVVKCQLNGDLFDSSLNAVIFESSAKNSMGKSVINLN
ncbi:MULTISPECIES: hypothetical protein [unclassified Haloferax]|uniref:hypothetical protein n=1 Tax=unclassified Haloferax TaxID=2625095 RepID=UPI0028759CE4|nr:MULTISPECIES: hypothetical protein [unclassified Haloferax]MDS0242250.1 hypothetical protein [Haloferax sp. S2CR25]MDS0445371.1 hypothetical protein [Haloferax sp. S2CR25-2]